MMHKYPRTQHLEGSRLQPGDEDLEAVPFTRIAGRPLVVEEKIDGANAAVSFDAGGELLLQSRGHYLTGGRRERHFDLFKAWATVHREALHRALGERFVMYGEWVYAKHTVFYDALPHYFLEFDLLDQDSGRFLSTDRRREILQGAPVTSVPVLHLGTVGRLDELTGLVTTSLYKTLRWREALREAGAAQGLDVARLVAETDDRDEAEGLYIKVEEQGAVTARYKWVRASFLTAVVDSGTHWLSRPILPNELAPGVDIFGSGGTP